MLDLIGSRPRPKIVLLQCYNVNVNKHCIAKNIIKNTLYVTDGQCFRSCVYEFESGYISPDPSLSFLAEQGQGIRFVIVSVKDSSFKMVRELL